MKQPFTKHDPLADSVSAVLEQTKASEAQELAEGVAEIEKIVATIKVGDKTNFGIVKDIAKDSITFKAKDTPKTKILFRARKLGSKEFILDKLLKLTKEEVELQESVTSDLLMIAKKFDDIISSVDPNGKAAKATIKEYGIGYKKDFAKIQDKIEEAYSLFEEIQKDTSV